MPLTTSVYDADGRLTFSTYLGDAGSAATCTYDANGRMTTITEFDGRGTLS